MTYSFNDTIPYCPSHNTPQALADVGYPTTAIIFVVFAATSLVFAITIAFKYNSVKVFNKKIRTQNISNTMWIIYYLTVGLRACVGAVLYGLNDPDGQPEVHHALFYTTLALSALNAFALCLSLNHQKRYRSSAPPAPAPQVAGATNTTASKESDPLLFSPDVIRRYISPAEVLFFMCFVVNLVFLFVAAKEGHSIFVIVYVGTYVLQRVPVVVLAFIIIAHRNGNEGPTRRSKVYLFFATAFHTSSDLPIFFWNEIYPAGCILFSSLSFIDVLTIASFVALILFFLFLRSEYLRNMEECIWTTVSQIQDALDFRRFY